MIRKIASASRQTDGSGVRPPGPADGSFFFVTWVLKSLSKQIITLSAKDAVLIFLKLDAPNRDKKHTSISAKST